MNKTELWNRYSRYLCDCDELALSLDISRMKFDDGFFERMEPVMQRAFASMVELEKGAIANPDEGRMVGHYWLRNAALAPTSEIWKEIETTIEHVVYFSSHVHSGRIAAPSGERFTNFSGYWYRWLRLGTTVCG